MANKRKTIGKMSNTRATWNINPVTKVKKDKTKYSRKINIKVLTIIIN
ncbi:hypothetical protein QLX37_gp010 [Staphylococcus phage SA5]|uniref:Uncharacterized protein n=1 Tax=Staphylococcus phage SA5 TaxID=1239385 RepID=K7R2B8_9CAUD|nr:hypothetical protein QLX37_gp010 [Staphylococcus phage SA5]AFV80886.1 hypothetical protein SA5_020 [Staphylococcus phage SA5]